MDLTVPFDTLFNFKQYVFKDSKKTFRYIFFVNYDYIGYLHVNGKLRNIAFDNIQKTILCSSVYLGYDLLECPQCDNETIASHTCSSRFCSKCCVKASQMRADLVSAMSFQPKHRHIVFTIPEQLHIFSSRQNFA